jgi:hypothetical protein
MLAAPESGEALATEILCGSGEALRTMNNVVKGALKVTEHMLNRPGHCILKNRESIDES